MRTLLSVESVESSFQKSLRFKNQFQSGIVLDFEPISFFGLKTFSVRIQRVDQLLDDLSGLQRVAELAAQPGRGRNPTVAEHWAE